jgi:hypothetical protein
VLVGGTAVAVAAGAVGELAGVGGTDVADAPGIGVLVAGTVVLVGGGPPAARLVARKLVMLAEPESTCRRRPERPALKALLLAVTVQALGSALPAAQALA